ncbi:MAG: hypothetical protein AB4911_13045 [Oscillochloridaceae bacterium umkhey_bin13]
MIHHPPDWHDEPSEAELHAEFLDWIGNHATPAEQRVILIERMRAARQRGDLRCPVCCGRQRRRCLACGGVGYSEPPLRSTTATEDLVAQDIATTRRRVAA